MIDRKESELLQRELMHASCGTAAGAAPPAKLAAKVFNHSCCGKLHCCPPQR